jgi:hypothetical protein
MSVLALWVGGLSSVSCPSPGNCVAGGTGNNYTASDPAWVITQHDWTWGSPVAIPGTLFQGAISSVSCSSVGNCGVDGYYDTDVAHLKTLVVTETHGHWGKLEQYPGMTALNKFGDGTAGQISCPLAGKCTAVGNYPGPREETSRPFLVSQVK